MVGKTANQQVLDENIANFRKVYKHAVPLLEYLKRDEVQIVRVEKGKQGRWSVFCVLPASTREMFDIDREVLVLATDYEKVEPRVLADLQRQLRENARVDDQLAVLVTADENAHRLTGQRAGETAILPLNALELPAGVAKFRVALAEMLTSVDHFNVTTPVSSPSAFFGRDRDIASVRHCMDRGQHVGIFGLRKAGKSSLLNRVAAIQRDRGWAVARLDLNEFFGAPTRFRSEIVRSLTTEATRLGWRAPRLQSLEFVRGDTVRAFWLRDLETVLDGLEGMSIAGVALVIDEIDTALPGRTLAVSEEEDELGLLRVLAQLRAVVQRRQSGEAVAPVVLSAGVDPALFEQPTIKRLANPLYQFATVHFIEPLDRDELQAMVRTLGKRTGMRFRAHELIDELYAEYGGHALLTRQACSHIHRNRPRGVVPYQVTPDDINAAISAKGPGTPAAHALDIPGSFEEWFPEEGEAVAAILEGRTPASHSIEHAIAYGLLLPDGRVRMRALTRRR